MRRDAAIAGLGFWLLVAAFLALMGGRARAQDSTRAVTSGKFQGEVVFSDVMIAPAAQFPTPAAMTDALRRLKRTTVEGADGFWRLHMVAFLDRAPPTGSFQLRATDVTDPKDRHEVKTFEVEGLPGENELPINDLVVTQFMGFERGHRYEIAVIPRGDDQPAGKPDVYAKGVITLM